MGPNYHKLLFVFKQCRDFLVAPQKHSKVQAHSKREAPKHPCCNSAQSKTPLLSTITMEAIIFFFMYMKRLARDLWFQIIMIRNMCHYPPELITQLETDVSCLGDSISETDGCLTSPVSICWSWRTDVVPHPSHLPPEIKKKKCCKSAV